MTDLPSGTVTFLFSDIEGSTQLAQQHPATWEATCQRHRVILRAACETQRGYVFQVVGDAFCVAFPTAPDALHAALAAQHALNTESWGDAVVNVRMGIHTGEAVVQEGQYRGYST